MAAESLLRFLSTSCPPGGLGDRARSVRCAAQQLDRRYKGRRRSLHLLQGSFTFRAVPATLRLDDPAATLGAVKVDAAAYRAAALDAQKTTGELLPGVVIVPPREHFAVNFGKDSHDSPGAGKEGDEAA